MSLATVIIKAEGKPPDPYMQGHPLMNFRRVRIESMRGKLEKSSISLVFTGF